jgi:LysM repeat protein
MKKLSIVVLICACLLSIQPAYPDPESQPTTYVVKKEDSLWSISKKFGCNLDDLIEANKNVIGSNPDVIFPDMVLVLPNKSKITRLAMLKAAENIDILNNAEQHLAKSLHESSSRSESKSAKESAHRSHSRSNSRSDSRSKFRSLFKDKHSSSSSHDDSSLFSQIFKERKPSNRKYHLRVFNVLNDHSSVNASCKFLILF